MTVAYHHTLEDLYLDELAKELDQCSDELSSAGDGCARCSCSRDCQALWDRIETNRNNKITTADYKKYSAEFNRIRSRRQVRMRLTV